MSLLKSRIATALAAAGAALLFQPVAQAFNFGDMMNPGKWMGGNKYDDEDYYYDRDYGPYGPPPGGYGYPPYGAPYGAPYGGSYGAPGYGPYRAPYGAAPAFSAPAQPVAPAASAPVTAPPAVATPAPAAPAARDAKSQEIEALKRRIDELEARQAPPPPSYPPLPLSERGTSPGNPATSGIGAGTALPPPSFRPLDKY